MQKAVREQIYESIRDRIIYGELHPGERIVEADLVREFKSSRGAVREALRLLESENLINAVERRGICVSKLSIKEVEELYDLRSLLESHAARLTAQKATKKIVVQLNGFHRKMIKAAKKADFEGWLENNAAFHETIESNCDNSNLTSMIQLLKRRVYRFRYMIVRIPGLFETYISHHENILNAIHERDESNAEKYMKLHLDTVKSSLLGHLTKFPGL